MITVDSLNTLSDAYLRVRGTLNQQSREVLSCMLEQAARLGKRRTIVDLTRVKRCEPEGLEVLLRAERQWKELGRSLQIVGARG